MGPWDLLGPRNIKYSLREVIVDTFIKEVPISPKVPEYSARGGAVSFKKRGGGAGGRDVGKHAVVEGGQEGRAVVEGANRISEGSSFLEPWNLLEPLFVKYSLRGVLVNTFIKEVPESSKVPE